jgi:hypothetical protein
MEISDKLSAFIKSEFESMVSYGKTERKEEQSHQREKWRRKKELARKLEKGLINDLEAEQIKLEYRKEDKEHIKPFGKTHFTFNNFVCLCWYLIKKETQAQDSDVHLWISNFLTGNNFRKRNDIQYTGKDLQRILDSSVFKKRNRKVVSPTVTIRKFEEGKLTGTYLEEQKLIKSYFDFKYDEFNNSQADRVYEKPSTWEYDLTLTWKELLK